MTSQEFADLMTARGYDVRPEPGGWRTVCPAHGGTDRNMTIRSHSEGGVVCTCHSHHCSRRAIVEALGLTTTDMVSPQARNAGSKGAHSDGSPTFRGNVAPKVYPYRDEAGTVLYEVVRTVGPEGKKTFAMRLPGAERGGVGEVRRVLFGLPELLLTKPGEVVCIAEGEKCAMAVALTGIAATTNPNGAGKWRPEYTAWLKEHLPGRRFLILPDNDTEGKKHAVAVGDSLEAAGLEVYLADLGTLPAKGDVVQWLAAGGTAEKLRAMAAPKRKSDRQKQQEEERRIISAKDLMAKRFEPLRWAVPGIIPEGLNILAGGPKTGKSWFAMHVAVAKASGGAVFGQMPVEKGGVLYLALEDSQRRLQDRLLKTLQGAAAPEDLYLVTHWDVLGEGFTEQLDEWLTAHPECRMVIVDVFQRVRPKSKPKGTEYQEDSDVMAMLQEVPRDHRVAMLVIHHTRKMTAPDPFDMVTGSVGITGGVDSILVLMRQRDQKDATLHTISREADVDAMALEWDGGLCCWKLLGKAQDHKLSAERKAVLDFLRRAKMDLGPAEIAGALEMNPPAVRYLLRQMEEDGQIIRSHYGKYTMTDYQKMSSSAPHTPHTPHAPSSPHAPYSDEEYEPGGEV